jgi:hypothetical protein
MSRPFEETRQIAEDALSDMSLQLARMQRTHRRYVEHGAVNAAAELQIEIEALDHDIQFEQDAHKLTFY